MAGFVHKCPCLKPQIDDDVRVLDYRHCSLADVPGEVFNFERTLEELLADSNQIRDLPRELFYCHGLRKLSIADNEITHIPPAISSLSNLEELDFSKNGIIDVPDNIKGCKLLRVIDASVNPLGKLPEGFTQLQNLTQLLLNDTFLDYLPGSFGRLTKLKILEIRENHLRTLPRSFSRLVELERLDIGNNELQELPDVIGCLTSLLELWCDNNQIRAVTPTIGNLKQLIFLDASKNRITALPREIEGCTSLADLHLTNNVLTELPESLGCLSHLTTLKVDDNQLVSLPRSTGGLMSLSELNASANDLESLPPSIGLLRNLRTLYADENLLESLPPELGSCTGLTVLSLRSNRLAFIPDELGHIPRLRVLNLSDNRLQHLPFPIVKLKELQALWLTDNQTRPLIPLQSDYEPHTGRKILTCYLLPQQPMSSSGEDDGPAGDAESFHASMWEEQRQRRQQIHFATGDNSDTEGVLLRCPTPYPKEMRERARHARNLALRQNLMGDDPWGADNAGFEDEEKLLRDKARMQQHRASTDRTDSSAIGLVSPRRKDKARGRDRPHSPTKSEPGSSRRSWHHPSAEDSYGRRSRGSDVAAAADDRSVVSEPRGPRNAGAYSSSLWGSDSPYVKLATYHHRSRHGRRMREYDSDTGYRSDQELMRFRRQQLGDGHRDTASEILTPRPRGRRGREGGYASDLEVYAGRGRRSAPQQPMVGGPLAPTNSLPYDLNAAAESHRRPHSDILPARPRSKSLAGEGVLPSSSQSEVGSAPRRSRDDIYATSRPQQPEARIRDPTYSSTPRQPALDSSLKQGSFHPSPSYGALPRPPPADRPPSRPLPDPTYTHLPPPSPVASHQNRPPFTPEASPSLFHRNKFLDQSTPVLMDKKFVMPGPGESRGQVPLPRGSSSSEERDPHAEWRRELSTVLEERKLKELGESPSKTASYDADGGVGRDSAGIELKQYNPPPYNPAPPYRRTPDQLSDPSRRSQTDSPQLKSPLSADQQSALNRRPSATDVSHPRNPPPPTPPKPRDYPSLSSFGVQGSPAQFEKRGLERSQPVYDLSQDLSTPTRHLGGDHSTFREYTPDRTRTPTGTAPGWQQNESAQNSPRGDVASTSRRERPSSRTSGFDVSAGSDQRTYETLGAVGEQSMQEHGDRVRNPLMSSYEDVARFKSEPPSQVSSSTDSGYGHVYERIGDHSRLTGSHTSSSTPPPHQPGGQRHSGSTSRETTPIMEEPSAFGSPETEGELLDGTDMVPYQFRVSITKTPGLGFSIAGGIGSYGNPFRHGDTGIFVTKVVPGGPATVSLRPGDKILEVNGVDFRNIQHTQAVTVMKVNCMVSMLVERLQKVNMV